MPREGLEPTRCCQQRILSPPRLPFRHLGAGPVDRLHSIARPAARQRRPGIERRPRLGRQGVRRHLGHGGYGAGRGEAWGAHGTEVANRGRIEGTWDPGGDGRNRTAE